MNADAVASELPYLRRFARALAGNQKSGDAYVAATLEALVADPSSFDGTTSPRVALYRAFLQAWNAVRVNNMTESLATGELATADRRLETMTPGPRQAFLLVALEGFDRVDAASILGVSEDEIGTLIDTAGREIAEQIATDVLIIEDEPLIALDLEHLVEDIGHRVVANARTRTEAVAAAQASKPGLVLADIQLADRSSGIDAVTEILESMQVPVIFITAYPERLLTGLRPEPTFLITKPFEALTVKAVISQALFFERAAAPPSRTAA